MTLALLSQLRSALCQAPRLPPLPSAFRLFIRRESPATGCSDVCGSYSAAATKAAGAAAEACCAA